MAKKPILGASLIFVGAWSILFGIFWNLVNYEDQGPRCTVAACPQSTLNWYWFVADTSTAIVVAAVIAVIFGLWLIFRK
ncbi:MAG TPA: hypothetical protein VGS11_10545 [Candidatus Bathyarchaeia archaeon]|nr:hypothetical protein [Candidatus Bathyarchaeia archaeon]